MEGDLFFVRTFNAREKWIASIVKKKSEPVSVHVKVSNGQIIRRHFGQMHKLWPAIVANNPNVSDTNPVANGNGPSTAVGQVPEDITKNHSDQPSVTSSISRNIGRTPSEPEPLGELVIRYSCGQHTKPQYLKDYVMSITNQLLVTST